VSACDLNFYQGLLGLNPDERHPNIPVYPASGSILAMSASSSDGWSATLALPMAGVLKPILHVQRVPGEWQPRMPEQLDEEELADWRAGRNAVYQLAALIIGARLAVANA
jgi:hypothetical protein